MSCLFICSPLKVFNTEEAQEVLDVTNVALFNKYIFHIKILNRFTKFPSGQFVNPTIREQRSHFLKFNI